MPIRVLIVDRRRVVADVMSQRLSGEPDLDVVATASSVREAAQAMDELDPDLLVVDLELGDGDGAALIRRHRDQHPDAGAVAVTSGPEQDSSRAALAAARAGALAFVPKQASIPELLSAIRAAAAGEATYPPAVLAHVLRAMREDAPQQHEWRGRVERLSPREVDVLNLMVAGRDRRSIAQELALSVNTVRTHTKNILAKLEVHSSLEAVSVALRAGMRPNTT